MRVVLMKLLVSECEGACGEVHGRDADVLERVYCLRDLMPRACTGDEHAVLGGVLAARPRKVAVLSAHALGDGGGARDAKELCDVASVGTVRCRMVGWEEDGCRRGGAHL